jgi:hypothetical protein
MTMAVTGCTCADCERLRRHELPKLREQMAKADAKAEDLLRRFLTPAQQKEWDTKRQITVVGSEGGTFRLTPRVRGTHSAVVRNGRLGVAVWPVGIEIEADWALTMMLYLMSDEPNVVASGCHDYMGSNVQRARASEEAKELRRKAQYHSLLRR